MSKLCGLSLSLSCMQLKGAVQDLRNSTNKLQFLVNRLLSQAVIPGNDSVDSLEQNEIKRPKVTKVPEWRWRIISDLVAERKQEVVNTRYKINRSIAVNELIRYAVSEDYSSLVAFGMHFTTLRKTQRSEFFGDDEFFAVVLLLAARGIQKCTSPALVDQAASISLYYSTATLLERLTLKGTLVRSAALVVLDKMEKWTDLRSIDERSLDIDKVFEKLQCLIKKELFNWHPKRDRLFLNDEDQHVINQRLTSMYGKSSNVPPVEDFYKYSKEVKLVSELNSPVSTTDYLGSPFHCPDFSEMDYLAKFRQQRKAETLHLLHVRNFCRNSKKITAEKLIEQWKWKRSIENLLAKRIKELQLSSMKAYLEKLDLSECASLIHLGVITACSSGQNLVIYSQFIRSLAIPILDYHYNRFIEKLGIKKSEIEEEVFLRYVKYFLDQEVARKYTLREWWMHCCFEAHVNEELAPPFADFGSRLYTKLGSFLSSVVFDACFFPKGTKDGNIIMTPAFSVRDVSLEEESTLFEENRVDLVRMVQIDSALMDLFLQHEFEWLIFPVYYLPMIAPPRPWIDQGKGGPSYGKPDSVIRFLEEYKQFDVNDEVKKKFKTRGQARPVFDALNDLGSTPWKINKETLSILRKVFNMCGDTSKEKFLSTLAVPLRADTVEVPDFVKTFGKGIEVDDISKERWIEFSKKKYEAVKKRIAVAEFWKDEILYFPHNMDFRGRVYPISPYLSHMGDDLNRALLLFAKGKPLGPDGLTWLKLHCINLTGKKKKEPINSRLAYAEEVLPKILDSANNPLEGEQWWLESDDPWQTLAACIEIRNAIRHGDHAKYICHFPVHQDGTCNGLQHYAALGRDSEGAREVNVLPCESPSDVYSGVAQRVEMKRIEDEKSSVENVKEIALSLRKTLPEVVPRKVIKQTVMTTVYGVTMYGAVQQIKRQLKARGIISELSRPYASYLAQKTFLSLDEAFSSSMKIKDWFRKCARTISYHFLRPVEWNTPLGLPVIQPYLRMQFRSQQLVFVPVSVKQMNAFPPNFVHSLDSTHMMLTALHCRRLGITFAAVHDCYWTHPCTVDTMNAICRDQFIKLHKEPLVEQCGKFFVSKYLDTEAGKLMPPKTYAEFKEVFTPKFVFGDLDIEELRLVLKMKQ